jgi:tripartite-type tricarboxylate transporter receptor subunit TctC
LDIRVRSFVWSRSRRAKGRALPERPAVTPDEFAARIKLEIDKWGKVVHDANLKIE